MRKLVLLGVLILTTVAMSQTVYLGPLIPPSQCVVVPTDPQGVTGLCFASDGVHVSLGGAAFGPPLPAVSGTVAVGTTITLPPGSPANVTNSGNPLAAVLDFGIPQGQQGVQGNPGTPGVIVGSILTGNLKCPPGKGTVAAGFTVTGCTFTVTAKQ